MEKRYSIIVWLMSISFIAITFSGCKTYTNFAYFRDIPDSLNIKSADIPQFQEPVIQPDDIMSIVIGTINVSNVSTSMITSAPSISTGGSTTPLSAAGSQSVSGFLVGKDGTVSLPIIGSVKLSGLTTYQASKLLEKEALKYYKEPNVQVRFANFKVTVLGEVAHPTTYIFPNEKVSVLDAIGMAGDLTIYGKRDNILLIRENNGKREFARLNLNKTNLFDSPYFYLRQGDVLIVEPNQNKIVASDASRTRNITIVASLAAAVVVLLTRIR